MPKRPALGDVFRLRIDADRVGFGQVVGTYGRDAYFFAIYELPHDAVETPDINEIVSGEIAFLALSLDALLHRGTWEIVGTAPPPAIRWPTYKESTAPGIFAAVDHAGKTLRTISDEEAAELPTRSIAAPIRVQKAFEALHGAGAWNPKFEDFRY